MIAEGSFVHSLDPRDDPKIFYVVIEANVRTKSGPSHRIAEPESPESWRYRQARLLVSADAEVAAEVAEAQRLAKERRA